MSPEYTLLGEWGFLNNLEDTSGNALADATVDFTPVYIDGPQENTRAIEFSGSGQTILYGRTGLEPTEDGITTMGWYKYAGPMWEYVSVISHSRDGGGSNRSALQLYGNTIFALWRWNDSVQFGEYGSAMADGDWHHIAIVDGPNVRKLYIDGEVAATQTAAGGTGTWEAYSWWSGEGFSASGSLAGFALTGIRLFQGELTDEQIVEWMDTPITLEPEPPSGSKIRYWDNDEWMDAVPKAYIDEAWVTPQVKVWTGSEWKEVTNE